MPRLLLTLFATVMVLMIFGQDCSCLSQFSFVRNYFESNNPAFQKIKNDPAAFADYKTKVGQLTKAITAEQSNDRCNIYFEQYIALLRDHHSTIDLQLRRLPLNFNSPETIDSFKSTAAYRSFRKIPVDTTALSARLKAMPYTAIEGLYTNDAGWRVGLIQTAPRRYEGVLLRSTTLADVGHVLLECSQNSDGSFDLVYHTGLLGVNFQHIYKTVQIRNGRIPELGLSKVDLPENVLSARYAFRELDTVTNYLRLGSFDRSLKPQLDSFYQSIDTIIQSKPFLIIDLRDNGGGAEDCYFPLMPYLYTQPFESDNVDVWVSPDNIRRYEEAGYDTKLIARMKQATPFTFIPQIEGASGKWTTDSTVFPRKVVVLFNRGTASSAESMITYCRQSSKVVTMGQPSGGFIGYGDVMAADVPCGKYTLRSTTTRYHNNSRYEFVGIEPEYRLTDADDWIDTAKKFLETGQIH